MPKKKHLIKLNANEQEDLLQLTRKGMVKARRMKRAMILLKANEGLSDPQIMAALNVSQPYVERIRKRLLTLPARSRRVERYDYEYARKGVACLNMIFEPLKGQRHVRMTPSHTMHDFAQCMKWLVDELYREAIILRVVLDNLGTHKRATLYKVFPPEEARRIIRELEFHHTPKHGSWLNMAEFELSIYSRALKQHIPDDEQRLELEVQTLTSERNCSKKGVDWQFFTADARLKLEQLYPSIPE